MENRARQRHRGLIESILSDVADGAESPLELRYLKDVERAHQLPGGRRQRKRLGLPYCSDVGYDAFQVLVELDGRIGHDGTDRFRDLDRDNRFATLAWLTLRYGWYDVVHRPCLVAFQVASVLINRGWPGLPSRCPRCSAVPAYELAV
jgi:very-short-patch-repair endonuclease